MKKLLAGALLVTAAAFPMSAQASPLPSLGGQCDGVVDVGCRTHVCQPDELDCGLIPPCFLWVAAAGCLL
jgi:hypothetical protein